MEKPFLEKPFLEEGEGGGAGGGGSFPARVRLDGGVPEGPVFLQWGRAGPGSPWGRFGVRVVPLGPAGADGSFPARLEFLAGGHVGAGDQELELFRGRRRAGAAVVG